MPKFNLSPAFIAATRNSRPVFREVCLPLYAPAFGEPSLYSAPRRDADTDDRVVDASGITIGGDDDEDDDFY